MVHKKGWRMANLENGKISNVVSFNVGDGAPAAFW
jgi:hypothetical protein